MQKYLENLNNTQKTKQTLGEHSNPCAWQKKKKRKNRCKEIFAHTFGNKNLQQTGRGDEREEI